MSFMPMRMLVKPALTALHGDFEIAGVGEGSIINVAGGFRGVFMHKKNGIGCVGREAVKAFIDLFSDGHGIGLLKKFRAPAAIVVERGVTGAGKAELGGAEALDDNGLTSGIFRGAPAPG